MRASRYAAATLAPLVRSSRTMAEVLRKLGLPPTAGNYRHLARAMHDAGLARSDLQKLTAANVPDADIARLVATSRSIAQVLAALNLPTDGRPHRDLSARITALGLDTSHFTRRAWSKGLTKATHPSIQRQSKQLTIPDDEVFVERSRARLSSGNLRARLLAAGHPYACEWCSIATWRGQHLVLHLDHINGIHGDNRRENLRLLCPNCHSQTETYCRRRR